MTQPKFAVGEVVILQSIDFPHLNGEKTVLMIVSPGEVYACPLNGRFVRSVAASIGYILDGGCVSERGSAMQWEESALRKRHQPGEHSWQDLKTILNLPVSRTELARLDQEVA